MPAKTLDKTPEPKKAPPKPAAKPVAQVPAVTAPPATAPAVSAPTAMTPSNGLTTHKPAAVTGAHPDKPAPAKAEPLPRHGSVPRPTDVIELQGAAQFTPGSWADYIKSFGGKAADVDVKWGSLAPRATIGIQWDHNAKGYSTKHDRHQPLPIIQPFFAGLPEKLAPALFVKVYKDAITGFAAPHKTEDVLGLAEALGNPKTLSALGLVGFKLPSPKFDNKIQNGHFIFGTEALSFSIAGWLSGSLKLGLVDEKVSFTATAHVAVRGIAQADLLVSRDKDGTYTGQIEIPVTLSKVSGNVLAKYVGGDVSITGTIKYTSEKFSGSLTVMFGEVNEVQKAARGQLDPDKLLAEETVKDDEKSEKGKKGEKGVGAWGEFAFTFTDWMTGTALGILDPFGHITIVGKITPVKQVELMKEHVWNTVIPPFPLEITARYGLPYVADVHVGVGFELGAVARIGPAVLTDIVVQGTYSTDPKVLQDFSISGAFRISAYAGLNLSVYGKAGLTILSHDIDFIAKITGSAGIKAYAEARPTIGYREKADPVAGKKGEAYLQGHLEAAAQPVLGLSGDLEIKLSTPWWSPVSDHTWTWPLFDLSWPLASSLGVAADIDYVIGSDKLPDIKLGQVDFDSSKFMDSMLDNQIPAKKSGGEQEKAGTWKGVEPKPPTAPASQPPKGPAPAGGKPAQAGTPSTKSGKGKQTPEEAANVPKTQDVSKRWLAGIQALGQMHDAAEKNPEDEEQIHADLTRLKRDFGFTRLDAVEDGEYWDVVAEMNPTNKTGRKTPASKIRRSQNRGWLGKKGEGKVGTYSQLKGPPGDNLTPHHIPQDGVMELWNPPGYSHSKGICFNMETKRHQATRTWGTPGAATRKKDATRSPVSVLKDDLENVTEVYRNQKLYDTHKSEIDQGLAHIRSLNEVSWPSLFPKEIP